jgi:DNA-directed RNA polymerase II subunit RPB4
MHLRGLKRLKRFTLLSGMGPRKRRRLRPRVLRNDPDLHKFEVAQLGSLCPEEAEEAKTLIPRYPLFFQKVYGYSLVSKKTDEDLQAILDELSSLRKFQ